jgi:hypothetical protein
VVEQEAMRKIGRRRKRERCFFKIDLEWESVCGSENGFDRDEFHWGFWKTG